MASVITTLILLGILETTGDFTGDIEIQKKDINEDDDYPDCTGVRYPLKGCPENKSSQTCVHAVHPFLKRDWKIGGDFFVDFTVNKHGLRARLECRPGVVSENLHNNRDLDMIHHVADSKQNMDFYWYRESGIRVNVGLESINLVPTYYDVEHKHNDNYFFSENPVKPNNSRFEEITSKYCRNPVPDYYTLTLEKAMDRATEAKRMRCTAGMKTSQLCPHGVRINEMFMQRSLNEPCHMLGSYPEVLEQATNSIACTEDHNMLRQLFNIVPSEVRVVTSPPKSCRQAESNCEYCMELETQNSRDLYKNICSMIDCLVTFDCKRSYSEFCRDSPIVCAMGDAYRYTLQSVFIERQPTIRYKCHLKHQEPTELYQLWFDIVIPGTHFRSPRHKMSIPSYFDGSESRPEFLDLHPTRGRYVIEFLNVEHDSGFIPYPELLLTAQNISETQWSYSLESIGKNLPPLTQLHSTEDFSKRMNPSNTKRSLSGMDASKSQKTFSRRARVMSSQPVQPNTITPNVKSINIRFDTPFHYTTVTWNDGTCQKDLSQFHVLSPSESENQVGHPDKYSMNISAIIGRTPGDSKLEYHLRSISAAPVLKFVIQANTSVLRWWLRQIRSELRVTEECFNVVLKLSKDERHWLFAINGSFTDCPGYLSVVIHDLTDKDELVNYDIVVPCPTTFNLTFAVPISFFSYRDKTFLMLLDDTKKIHPVYLSIFINHRCVSKVSRMTGGNLQLSTNDCVQHGSKSSFVSLSKYVALLAFLVSAFASVLIAFLVLDAFSIKRSLTISKTFDHSCFVRVHRRCFRNLSDRSRDRINSGKETKSCKNLSKRTCITVAYVIITLFSICAFTLNFINLIVRLRISSEFQMLMESIGGLFKKWQISWINTENLAEERLENNFVLLGELPISSIEACNSYVNRILKYLASQYQRLKATHVKSSHSKHLLHMKIWNSVEEKINYYRKEVNHLVTKNKRRVCEEIDDTFKTHLAGTTYLLESPWFIFLQHLQNLTPNASKDNELQSLNDSNFKTLREDYKSFFFNKVKVFQIASHQKWKNKLPSKHELNGGRPEIPEVWNFISNSTNANDFICSRKDEENPLLSEEHQIAHRFSFSSPSNARASDDQFERSPSSSNRIKLLNSNFEMDVEELLLSLEWQLLKIVLCFMDFALIVHRLTKLYLEMTVNYLIVSIQTRTNDSKRSSLARNTASNAADSDNDAGKREKLMHNPPATNMPLRIDFTLKVPTEIINFQVSRKFKELIWFFESVTPPKKDAINKNKILRFLLLLGLRKSLFYIFTLVGLTSLLGFSLTIFFEEEINRQRETNAIQSLAHHSFQRDFIARLFRDIAKEKFLSEEQILRETEYASSGFSAQMKEMKILSNLIPQSEVYNDQHKSRSCEENLCAQSGLTEHKIFKGLNEWDLNLVPCAHKQLPLIGTFQGISHRVEGCFASDIVEKCFTLLSTCWLLVVIIFGIYLSSCSLRCFLRHNHRESRKAQTASLIEGKAIPTIKRYQELVEEPKTGGTCRNNAILTVDECTNYKHHEDNPLSNSLSFFSETDV